MRDIIFKNTTSLDKRRRDLVVSEVVENAGYLTKTERKSIYIISQKSQIQSPKNLPQLTIFKSRNSQRREEKFICKMAGRFYVATKQGLFSILFVHSFKSVKSVIAG